MYKEHEQLFDLDGDCILWKYMSFSKFVNLLNGKIYFNRLDNFEDVFEGTFPQYNLEHRKDIYKENAVPEYVYNQFESLMKKYLYVSCFHKSEFETAFMWKQYANDDGIAIKTSAERLKKSFSKTVEDIYICNVQYIDYDTQFMPEGNGIYLALHKRKSFEPENEVRCVHLMRPTSKGEYIDPKEMTPNGRLINIDLKELVEEIYISPYAQSYIKDNVNMIASKFGISANIIQSPLFKLN